MLTVTITIDAASRPLVLATLEQIRKQIADGLVDGHGGTNTSSFSFQTKGEASVIEEPAHVGPPPRRAAH